MWKHQVGGEASINKINNLGKINDDFYELDVDNLVIGAQVIVARYCEEGIRK